MVFATAAAGALLVAAAVPASGQAADEARQALSGSTAEPFSALSRSDWTIVPNLPTDLSDASPTMDVMPVVADRIYELGAERGFAGQRTDYNKRAISVLWKGAPAPDIMKYLTSKPLGVAITVTETARYSRQELEQARARLLNSPKAAALGIAWTDLNDDASGMRIGVRQTAALSSTQKSELRSAAGIDSVDPRTGNWPAPRLLASKINDSAPWKGGARTRHYVTTNARNACTSGFSVLKSDGAGRLLSAHHCDPSANLAVKDGNNDTIASGGSTVSGKAGYDSLLIDPSASPATTPKIYRGDYDGSTTSTVKSWASNWPGDPVCSSGATSGEHCGEVYDDGDTYEYVVGSTTYQVPVIQVHSVDDIMGAEGDSGGPVFKKVTGGVQARGILQSADQDGRDDGNNNKPFSPEVCEWFNVRINTDYGSAADDVSCSQYINYVPISVLLNQWGVTLETG